eukprot:CAMPEP_0174714616 /NCGR_PEP_ID=MMETSP1094-20130205/18617_1 /TAXON_ID=156173 /ORGANISM="Chrysochromulina brevifilum, Strain UTEX LB 985" /LENGTH=387 /DNA_ID=CAMNT_0015914005 /DNA_START=51 /DNA_END=1214 /DNA_ORIENTATION=-
MTIVGNLVRTASFGRSRSRTDSRLRSRSESRTPPDTDAHHQPEVGIPTSQPRLYGWLQKQHRASRPHGSQWARRYFFFDEKQGTLGYAKGPGKPLSIVLPIADVTRIEPINYNSDSCAFLIYCPYYHLTVAASSIQERDYWVAQLELRMNAWQVTQATRNPKVHCSLPTSDEIMAEPRPPRAAATQDDATDISDVTSEAPVSSSSLVAAQLAAVAEEVQVEAATRLASTASVVVSDMVETFELDSDEDSNEDDEDDEGRQCGAEGNLGSGASLWRAPAPVPLASLISSDEEEEEGEGGVVAHATKYDAEHVRAEIRKRAAARALSRRSEVETINQRITEKLAARAAKRDVKKEKLAQEAAQIIEKIRQERQERSCSAVRLTAEATAD